MSSKRNSYEYKILPESPAMENGLSDGIHENVANQLLGVFESSTKGIAIGLEGKWDSGKSTIVNVLKQKLPSENAHVFIFDAWAHEGDLTTPYNSNPLKAAFKLETMRYSTFESLVQALHPNAN